MSTAARAARAPARLQAAARSWPAELAGSSDLVQLARSRVISAASRDDEAAGVAGVLIVTDRGFDAAAIAREIHARGPHPMAPFELVDCAADRVERVLFGRPAPGRGRKSTRADALESIGHDARLLSARGGTLVLTSVVELPASAQLRLARLMRDGEARVSGSGRAERLSLRVVATARSPIEADLESGRLREELFRRLASHRVDVPSLAGRREDLPAIARLLLREALDAVGAPQRTFTQAALALVAALPWEGNVDELRRVAKGLARANDRSANQGVRVEDVLGEIRLDARPGVLGPQASLREARRQFEREYIAAVLRHHHGRMEPTARMLGIQRTNLYRKARQLGIARSKAAE
jgi:two-component system nitrogen regulation response regulator NtrX